MGQLIFEQREWPDRAIFGLSLGFLLFAGVAARLLLGYQAADLTLEGAFLAGLIDGPYLGVTVGVLVFYIVAANKLGFLVTGAVILLALFLKLGVRARIAFPVAIGMVFVIHIIFYKLLRVGLPWGVMPILY